MVVAMAINTQPGFGGRKPTELVGIPTGLETGTQILQAMERGGVPLSQRIGTESFESLLGAHGR